MVAMLFCANVSSLEAQTTEVASDNFNRPDGPIGTNWSYTIASQPLGSFSITNGLVVATLPTNHIEAYWSANSFSPDQYSQARLSSIGPFTGVILRADNGFGPDLDQSAFRLPILHGLCLRAERLPHLPLD